VSSKGQLYCVRQFLCRIYFAKFPSCVNAMRWNLQMPKRIDLKGARFSRCNLPVHNDRESSLFPASILCFFCALLSRYYAVGMRLTVFLRRRSKCNEQLSPERGALPRAVRFQRQKTGTKRKTSRVLSQPSTRVPGLSARISTARGAPLVPGKLHDSRNKVLVEFLRNGHK